MRDATAAALALLLSASAVDARMQSSGADHGDAQTGKSSSTRAAGSAVGGTSGYQSSWVRDPVDYSRRSTATTAGQGLSGRPQESSREYQPAYRGDLPSERRRAHVNLKDYTRDARRGETGGGMLIDPVRKPDDAAEAARLARVMNPYSHSTPPSMHSIMNPYSTGLAGKAAQTSASSGGAKRQGFSGTAELPPLMPSPSGTR